MADNVKASTNEPIRSFEPLADRALTKPRSRDVILAGQLTDEERAAIALSAVPSEVAALDDELKKWLP
jgi:hypothetical protein